MELCHGTPNILKKLGRTCIYSVLYPESERRNFPKCFRKRSVYHLRIQEVDLIGMRFLVSVTARFGVNQSVVFDSCLRTTIRSLKEAVGISHISSIPRS